MARNWILIVLTVDYLLDAIFSAKRLEDLQSDVRDAMIKCLIDNQCGLKLDVTDSPNSGENLENICGSIEFPGS